MKKKPKIIKPGSTVGIFAPGAPADPELFKKGLESIERLGFKTCTPIDPTTRFGRSDIGFASASVQERVGALNALVKDPAVDVLIAARGGYGSSELLPELDFKALAQGGKPVVGFSDVTVLLVNIFSQGGFNALHGPSVAGDFANYATNDDAKRSVDILLSLLSGDESRVSFSCTELRRGKGEGKIIAGNLTLLQTLLGTPWDISYDGAILMLEDVGEAPYRVHRALTQLKLAGKFKKLAGVVFGRFSKCSSKQGPAIEEVLRNSVNDIFEGTKYPIVMCDAFGHEGLNITLPLGCSAVLDGQKFEARY